MRCIVGASFAFSVIVIIFFSPKGSSNKCLPTLFLLSIYQMNFFCCSLFFSAPRTREAHLRCQKNNDIAQSRFKILRSAVFERCCSKVRAAGRRRAISQIHGRISPDQWRAVALLEEAWLHEMTLDLKCCCLFGFFWVWFHLFWLTWRFTNCQPGCPCFCFLVVMFWRILDYLKKMFCQLFKFDDDLTSSRRSPPFASDH